MVPQHFQGRRRHRKPRWPSGRMTHKTGSLKAQSVMEPTCRIVKQAVLRWDLVRRAAIHHRSEVEEAALEVFCGRQKGKQFVPRVPVRITHGNDEAGGNTLNDIVQAQRPRRRNQIGDITDTAPHLSAQRRQVAGVPTSATIGLLR